MFDVFEEFATNETLENEGTWVPHKSAKFKIARTGTRKYAKVLSKLVDENRLLLDKGDEASEKLSDDLMVKTLAETILLDWEGVTYKGKPMKYSVTNAATLLSHRDFRRLVMSWADDIVNFKDAQVQEHLGN